MERTNSIQWNPYISMFFIDAGRALYVFFMGTSYLFSMGVMLSYLLHLLLYFLTAPVMVRGNDSHCRSRRNVRPSAWDIAHNSIRKGKATGSSV